MHVKNCAKAIKPMLSYTPHSHPNCVEIVYQNSGSYSLTANGKNYKIKQGDVIIIPPGVFHSGNSDGEPFTDLYLQCADCDFTELHVTHDSDGAILSLVEMIYRVITEKGDRYHEIADSLLEAICAYLHRYVNQKSKYSFVDGFKSLVYENLSNCDFDLAEEIKKFGYSADHFRRCFKEETNLTPLEYLTSIRINRAKKLVRAVPYQSIENIAVGCGFSDEFYFSRVFKKYTGMSPREYRRTHS